MLLGAVGWWLTSSQGGGGWSCFVASSGLPATNTSIKADFKGLYAITAAKLGKDAQHWLPSADASWLPQTPSSQTHVLGSSVKNISVSCSEVSTRSKGTEGLMEMGQILGTQKNQATPGRGLGSKVIFSPLYTDTETGSGMLCPRRVDFYQSNMPWRCLKQCLTYGTCSVSCWWLLRLWLSGMHDGPHSLINLLFSSVKVQKE